VTRVRCSAMAWRDPAAKPDWPRLRPGVAWPQWPLVGNARPPQRLACSPTREFSTGRAGYTAWGVQLTEFQGQPTYLLRGWLSCGEPSWGPGGG